MVIAFLIFECGLCGETLEKVSRPHAGEDQNLITPFYCDGCKEKTGRSWSPGFLVLEDPKTCETID